MYSRGRPVERNGCERISGAGRWRGVSCACGDSGGRRRGSRKYFRSRWFPGRRPLVITVEAKIVVSSNDPQTYFPRISFPDWRLVISSSYFRSFSHIVKVDIRNGTRIPVLRTESETLLTFICRLYDIWRSHEIPQLYVTSMLFDPLTKSYHCF